MTTGTKFDTFKFNGEDKFQYLEAPDDGHSHPKWVKEGYWWKIKETFSMTDEQCKEFDEKTLLMI